jgi:hypothetical protein
MRRAIRGVIVGGARRGIYQFLWFSSSAMEVRRRASPTRFIRAVTILAPRAVGVWK